MNKYLLLLPLSMSLLACAEQLPNTFANMATHQAAYLDVTKRQCTGMLGGSGVGEFTRESQRLKQTARELGADPTAYAISEGRIKMAFAVGAGMSSRTNMCNQFVTESYDIIAESI